MASKPVRTTSFDVMSVEPMKVAFADHAVVARSPSDREKGRPAADEYIGSSVDVFVDLSAR